MRQRSANVRIQLQTEEGQVRSPDSELWVVPEKQLGMRE